LERHSQPVVPVEVSVVQECQRLMPSGDAASSTELRWNETRVTIHNCTWLLSELLHRLMTSRLTPGPVVAAVNDVLQLLVELACKSSDDVGITAPNKDLTLKVKDLTSRTRT